MTNTNTHDAIRAAAQNAIDAAVAAGSTPGAVCAIAVGGHRIGEVTAGWRATVDAAGEPVVEAERVPADAATKYDLASITKLFTAGTMLALVGRGALELDAPIGDVLSEFANGARRAVTLRALLSHVSGLPGTWPGWRASVRDIGTDASAWHLPDRAETLHALMSSELVRESGSGYEYSCVGYITAMALAERATGRGWQQLVTENVLQPLALESVTFGAPAALSAPTERQPTLGRPLVWGDVHDETAYALGGISGNAGLFATADALLGFGLAIEAGLPGVLGATEFDAFWSDAIAPLITEGSWDAETTPLFGQGLGPRIGQRSWMTARCPNARGHNGFTGTSLMVDPDRSLVIALLANRVHPSRDGADGNTIRSSVTDAVCSVIDSA